MTAVYQVLTLLFAAAGPHDNVKCFYCDGGLKNWQPDDKPWVEHARWFPRCDFLIAQRDANYIRSVQDAYQPNLVCMFFTVAYIRM